ncbi:MAG: GntR family transcriptional regulator [Abditibacteriota bacterium]|nr:GntR family transcriptional regulator [Abditibacteriota bacterium]
MTKKQQIIDYINNHIKENNLKYGDKLISEVLLAETLNVNRNTIRSAFTDLEQEGIIKRIRGSGTFVAKNNEKKKYILIVSTTYSTKGDTKKLYRFFCKILNKYIIDKGYTPLYFIANDILDIETSVGPFKNEIDGAISLSAELKDLQYIASLDIPIVDILRFNNLPYPTVSLDYIYLYKEIINQINKMNAQNVLVFTINPLDEDVDRIFDCYPFHLEAIIFEKYSLYRINYISKKDKGEGEIIEILDTIKTKPDLIVFTDNNLFDITSEYFRDYPNIFKDTPIITQSHAHQNYNEEYKISRLEFDLYKVGREAIELLNALIENKPLIEYNKIIKPKLIPSEYKK